MDKKQEKFMRRLFGTHRQTIVYEKDGKIYLDKECQTPSLCTLEGFNALSSDIRKNVKIISSNGEITMLNKKGFTLFELLFVIAIIGILASFVPSFFRTSSSENNFPSGGTLTIEDQQKIPGGKIVSMPGRRTLKILTIEDLQKMPGGKIVGMQKILRYKSYIIDILYQKMVLTYSVTPETYYQLNVGMDLPRKE